MAESLGAAQLLALLAERHSSDTFVPECKNGPTHTATNLLRFDAWAMPSSWAHWSTIGYEIKVSRQDFERDQKWPGYLDYCDEFYFVCPSGLIKATDLPKGIGLIWASVNGTKLYTKVKPERREPSPGKLIDLMSYVLMCRTKIKNETGPATIESTDKLYRTWVEQADKRRELAACVGGHVRAAFDRQEQENRALQEQVNVANQLRTFLEEAGVPWPETHWSAWETKKQLAERTGQAPRGLLPELRNVHRQLEQWIRTVEQRSEVTE